MVIKWANKHVSFARSLIFNHTSLAVLVFHPQTQSHRRTSCLFLVTRLCCTNNTAIVSDKSYGEFMDSLKPAV